ncbi:MAG: hypothetical protein KGO96_07450 [Elusimicrobia bacterium]|nr:hypothetical protein [Elusimicrobiota bacterium]
MAENKEIEKSSKPKTPEDSLTKVEKKALKDFFNGKYYQIEIGRALQLYELFLNDVSCEDIARINNIGLGQVIDARIRLDWDGRKERYIDSLFNGIEQKVHKTKLESISFMSDMISVMHKRYGAGVKKYLQTGDLEDLDPEIRNFKMRDYRFIIEQFMGVTEKKQPPLKIEAEIKAPEESKITEVIDINPGNVKDYLEQLSKIEDKNG